MNLFQQLFNMMNEDTDLNIKVSKTGNSLVVLVHPKSSKKPASTSGGTVKTEIPPLAIRGTAAELDEGFIQAIKTPLEKATGVIADIQWYENALDSIKDKKQKELDAKNKRKKPAPNSDTNSVKGATPTSEKASDPGKENSDEIAQQPKDQTTLF